MISQIPGKIASFEAHDNITNVVPMFYNAFILVHLNYYHLAWDVL